MGVLRFDEEKGEHKSWKKKKLWVEDINFECITFFVDPQQWLSGRSLESV